MAIPAAIVAHLVEFLDDANKEVSLGGGDYAEPELEPEPEPERRADQGVFHMILAVAHTKLARV